MFFMSVPCMSLFLSSDFCRTLMHEIVNGVRRSGMTSDLRHRLPPNVHPTSNGPNWLAHVGKFSTAVSNLRLHHCCLTMWVGSQLRCVVRHADIADQINGTLDTTFSIIEHRSKKWFRSSQTHLPFHNAEKQFQYHQICSGDSACAHMMFLEVWHVEECPTSTCPCVCSGDDVDNHCITPEIGEDVCTNEASKTPQNDRTNGARHVHGQKHVSSPQTWMVMRRTHRSNALFLYALDVGDDLLVLGASHMRWSKSVFCLAWCAARLQRALGSSIDIHLCHPAYGVHFTSWSYRL